MEKELKRLSRRELVDVIYQMKKNEEQMQEKIASLQNELQDKRIQISVAGSIAEAATDITKIFSVAQATADIYLEEIAHRKEETEKECEAMISEAKKKAEQILSENEKKLEALKEQYQTDCKKLEHTQAEIQILEQLKKYKETENGEPK